MHITTTYNVLGDDLDNDSESELGYDWVIKNPVPPARRPPPRAMPHLFQAFTEYLISPRPLRLLLGFRPPPFPQPPRARSTFPRRARYRFVSSRRSRVYFSGFYKRAAGVPLHSGTPLPTRGVSLHSSPRVYGGVSLYFPPPYTFHEDNGYTLP